MKGLQSDKTQGSCNLTGILSGSMTILTVSAFLGARSWDLGMLKLSSDPEELWAVQ